MRGGEVCTVLSVFAWREDRETDLTAERSLGRRKVPLRVCTDENGPRERGWWRPVGDF